MSEGGRLPFWHPASLIATWFGSGLLPKAPGTWGSLAALPFAALILALGGPWALLAASLLAFGLGLWAGALYAEALGAEDPDAVVIDEVAGMWLALVPLALASPGLVPPGLVPPGLVPHGLDLPSYAVAFLCFRVFDIVKVWPANVMERRLKGGLGIMADDMVAGLYAGAASLALVTLIGL